MLGMLGGNAIISSFIPSISEKINEYITTSGKELISNSVNKEINNFSNTSLVEMSAKISDSEIDWVEILIKIYEKVITSQISNLLNCINISQIVTDKINNMDTLELEKLILLIMKKELNALVNLGAIIGFILGLSNLLF